MLSKIFKKSVPKEKKEHHFIFIESPLEFVAPQVLSWQDAEWWPAQCALKYLRVDSGSLGTGTRFKKKLRWLVPLISVSEISNWNPPQGMEWTFKKGPIKGHESVAIEGRYNGTKVTFEMVYQIKGIVNKFLWAWVFHKRHEKSMKQILDALRIYCLAQKRL